MVLNVQSDFKTPTPAVRRELVELLYTSFPQVLAISATSAIGAIALATIDGDPIYALAALLIAITATVRLVSLRLYPSRAPRFSDDDVVLWERIYGIGAAAFGTALGLLSVRALCLNDAPGAWLAFGLSMSFCVGMVSRAAIRPWVVLLTAALLLGPTLLAGVLRPEMAYRIGAAMLVLFWITLREASRHLSTAFIERIESKQALAQQASQDFLTGLPNRAAFLSSLRGASGALAIVAIDLDGFKPVNDQHGHLAGDELLRQVGERLRQCVGERGIAARFGGDEFMLLGHVHPGQTGRDEAVTLARNAVVALSLPFRVVGIPVRIGASAGIIVADQSQLASATGTAEMLEQVDHALYAAKRAGGGCWTWAGGDRSDPLRAAS